MRHVIKQQGALWRQIQCKEKREDRLSAKENFDKKLWISTNYLQIFSGLSRKFYRQYLKFHLVVDEEQSKQAREKNAHLTSGEGRWLTRTIKTKAFYKLLTWTRLENNLRCQHQKNPYGSFWYFSILCDEIFMLFLPPALSWVHTHTHTQQRS